MQIFNAKPEVINKNKQCTLCDKLIIASIQQKMYYGHSHLPNKNGDCSVWICTTCVNKEDGYISECNCESYL